MNGVVQLIRLKIAIVLILSLLGLPTAAVRAEHSQDELIILAEGTPLNVVTAQELSSKTANLGDEVVFTVDEDLVVNGKTLISKGTTAKGSVMNAEPSGYMGKSGRLGIVVQSTTTVDGQPVKLRAAKGKEGKDKTDSTAALTILVSGLFLLRRGTDAKIPAGTRVTVYVAEERRFRVDGATLVAVQPAITESPANDQPATVYVYRPSKMVGGALEPSVFLDDKELARMDNGRYFAMRLPPGKHIIHLTNEKKGYAIDMGPGETYYFRVGIEPGMWKGKGKLTLDESGRAIQEIRKIKFIGKDKIKAPDVVIDIPLSPSTP